MSDAIQQNQEQSIGFTRIECPPSRWTFEPDSVRRYIERWLDGRVLNLFAGQTELRHDDQIIRNDINPDVHADYHFDAREVSDHFEPESFDVVILDPPFNVRKSREKYNGRKVLQFTRVKDQVARIVKPSGLTIHLGYDSTGMSHSRGFELVEICLLNHKGTHNDTIVTIERRFKRELGSFAVVAELGGDDSS